MKWPVVESKRKPPSARKSLFEKIEEPSHEQMNNKTQVSEAFCINCHNYKEEIEKILKKKTEQQISINKLEEKIKKMQPNINDKKNKTKLQNDSETTKSKIFSHENISQYKEMCKSTTGLETDSFQADFEFLYTGPRWESINFYDGQNDIKPKSYPQDVKDGKKTKLLAIDQFSMYLSWFRNGFTIGMLSWISDISKSTILRYLD